MAFGVQRRGGGVQVIVEQARQRYALILAGVQRLYDTHWRERFLGLPQLNPEGYDRSSTMTAAASLTRPLLLIHGMADDNVVVAHTLRLSSALLAAGRPHTVLPLSGVTHMARQEEVAENLMLLQVEFLKRTLGMSPG